MLEEDAVLVTNRVGETVKRAANGNLLIGYGEAWMRLGQGGIEGLGKAAVRSLRMLDNSGVLHGDFNRILERSEVKLCNPVLEKKDSRRVWWIDVGLSRQCSMPGWKWK